MNFKYGMKRDFDAWLATLGPDAPVRTLTELREWNLEHRDAGAMKYEQSRYDYIIHRTPKGGSETISSYRKFVDIMRRQEDGTWRVYKHIWNYNEPDVVP